jgi:predicted tellurium resistance membrane protein TerC
VAKLLQRYPWMTYVGVLLVLYISLSMIWRGSGELPQLLHHL